MNKQHAIDALGGTPVKAARAMGYKSVHAIYMWPDVLPQSVSDRVTGAIARLGKPKRKAVPMIKVSSK